MNARPHTREVRIERQYTDSGTWRIIYGDTRVNMVNWWHFLNKEAALKKRIVKAIRRHDRGSLKAGDRNDMVRAIQAAHNEMLVNTRDHGSYTTTQPKQDVWRSYLLEQGTQESSATPTD